MTKNQFIHDLRNPLNTISINAELGKLMLERTGDVSKVIGIFEVILAECRRGGQILDEVKDFGSLNGAEEG